MAALHLLSILFFFFNDTATTEIYTLSLHDALPIFRLYVADTDNHRVLAWANAAALSNGAPAEDRKSTRLNSSHSQISYAVFCLKKKKKLVDIQYFDDESTIRPLHYIPFDLCIDTSV